MTTTEDDEVVPPASDDGASPEQDEENEAFLDQNEIDGLFGIAESDDSVAGAAGIEALVSGNTIRHRRLPLLEICFDRLAHSLSKSLRNLTLQTIEIGQPETTSVYFGDYFANISLPTMISVFRAAKWESHGLVKVDGPMVYALTEVLMGGSQASERTVVDGRSFTSLESTLAARMVKVVLQNMSEAFEPLGNVEFLHERMETNPDLAKIGYATAKAILCKIEIDMEGRSGGIEIVIPYVALESVRHLLEQRFTGEKFGRDPIWEAHWTNEILHTDAELEVAICEKMMRLRDIMDLKVGSTIQFHAQPDDLVTLSCEKIPLMRGKIGKCSNVVALEVDEWIVRKKPQ